MDIRLPDVDGIEAMRQIRLDPSMSRVPIIAVTASVMPNERETIDYGAVGTVTNLAARLCGEAQGGDILVSQRVVVAVLPDDIRVEPAGDLILKDFARPVAAFRAVGSNADPLEALPSH